jgi:hypothetical protein
MNSRLSILFTFNELVAPFFAFCLEENENELPMHSSHLFGEANLFQIMATFSHA